MNHFSSPQHCSIILSLILEGQASTYIAISNCGCMKFLPPQFPSCILSSMSSSVVWCLSGMYEPVGSIFSTLPKARGKLFENTNVQCSNNILNWCVYFFYSLLKPYQISGFFLNHQPLIKGGQTGEDAGSKGLPVKGSWVQHAECWPWGHDQWMSWGQPMGDYCQDRGPDPPILTATPRNRDGGKTRG